MCKEIIENFWTAIGWVKQGGILTNNASLIDRVPKHVGLVSEFYKIKYRDVKVCDDGGGIWDWDGGYEGNEFHVSFDWLRSTLANAFANLVWGEGVTNKK